MKKEIILTAIVFFSVGFLLGYVFDAQRRSEPAPAPAAAAPDSSPASQQMQGLPEGHPPLNSDTMIQALREQAVAHPNDAEASLRVANALYDQQRFSDAAEWYEKALKRSPRNVNAHTDLGTVYYNLGRAQDALAEYRKSLEIDPRHEPTLYNIIVVYLDGTHDLAAARKAWDRLHQLNPNYPGLDKLQQGLEAAGAARP